MAYQPKDGSGALFRNDKGDNPARPDYRGDIMLNGVLYEISGWLKPLPSDASKRFMSLSGKPKGQQQVRQQGQPRQAEQRQQQRTAPRGGFEDMDNDVPW